MLSPDLQQALESAESFPDVLDRLFHSHYTGPLTLHFYAGRPCQFDLPAPPAKPVRISLDRRRTKRGLTPPAPVPHSIG